MIQNAAYKIRESISQESAYFGLNCDEVSDVENIEWVA